MRRYFVRKGLCLALAAALLALSGCGEGAGQTRENPSGDNRESGDSGYGRTVDVSAEDVGGRDSADVATGNTGENAGASASASSVSGAVGGSASTEDEKDAGGRGRESGGTSGEGTDAATAIADFGVRLLQQVMEAQAPDLPPHASMPEDVYRRTERGENILLSPLSVVTALAMSGGGAGGETLTQMEEVLGISLPELSGYLSDYMGALLAGENYKLSMADSIWFTEDARFTVRQDFLDAGEKLFDAGIYRIPFDASAAERINGWVEKKTDGMIKEILDKVPADAVMYLVNALAFDAEWQEIYREGQVREGVFITRDGTAQKADMMYSSESWYLEDGDAKGFLKYYAEEKYAFAALLPAEGKKISEYVASLTGEKLRGILDNPIPAEVDACIPGYESEYAVDLNEILQSMGMEDAFSDVKADFSGIGYSESGNLYISRVLHKTFISVHERGTKAGAATAVEIKDGAAAMEAPDRKTVYLDRPFAYLIIDCETGIPVFIGVVMRVDGQ